MLEAQTGHIAQISVSSGGVPKLPIERTHLGELGLSGDKQRNLRHHGGPTRAVCLYSMEQIRALQEEGHPITPGAVGENLTTEGIDLGSLAPGDRLVIGDDILLEITSYTVPCNNLLPFFCDGSFTRISQKLHPGWSRLYARVINGGELYTGQPVRVVMGE